MQYTITHGSSNIHYKGYKYKATIWYLNGFPTGSRIIIVVPVQEGGGVMTEQSKNHTRKIRNWGLLAMNAKKPMTEYTVEI